MTRKAKKAKPPQLPEVPSGRTAGSKRKRQKTGLNRSILDVGWSQLTQAIKYKLEEGSGVFVEVPTKTVKPSQRCPKCLDVQPKTLSERVHHCLICHYIQQRDLASAEVMLLWASNSAAFGTNVVTRRATSSTSKTKERKNCGSMKQLGALKREKHRPTGGNSETPPSSRAG